MTSQLCPNCHAATRAQARFCSICGITLAADEQLDLRGYQSVLRETSYLNPEWQAGFDAALARSNKLTIAPLASELGKRRDPLLVMVLPLVSFGLYGLFWWWRSGREIRRYLQGSEPLVWRDLALLIITGGLWRFVMHYNYAARIADMQEMAQLPRSDYLKYLCPALSLCLLGFVSLALMQSELNKIWEAHEYGRR